VSQTWNAHIGMVNGLLDAERARRQERQLAAATTRAQMRAATMADPLASSGSADYGMGGEGGGDKAPAGGNYGSLGGFPNAHTLASAMDINPTGARLGLAAVGLLNPGLGMGLGALNTMGNIANTASNYGMLSGLGVNPGFGSTVGGLLGFNGLAGNATSALNAAMAGRYDGFANLSPAQADGFNFGGWADIAAAMDAANAEAMAGAAMSNPSGGWGDRGDISAETLY